tara:strand:- start:976 stop:1977 length:1002 start_codon:yes stop_codon:yes gene_type:complete
MIDIAKSFFISIIVILIIEIFLSFNQNLKLNASNEDLITYDAYNEIRSNSPNIYSKSFGSKVYTDINGFRIPHPNYIYPDNYSKRILLLGDSVTFGPGVIEENTFSGLLRKNYPNYYIMNSSVNGYNLDSYFSLSKKILQDNSFDQVLMIMCLNDVYDHAETIYNASLQSNAVYVVENFRKINFILHANNFLRSYSRIYLLIKGIFTDPSYRYFVIDYQNYENDANYMSQIETLDKIANLFKINDIKFTIIISPYEYQLREDLEADSEIINYPQKKLKEFFENHEINFHDPYEFFMENNKKDKKQLFLSFDPMHLSEAGHQEMYNFIKKTLLN